MRTTITIDYDLLRLAKRPADEGHPLTSLVEEGSLLALSKAKATPRKPIGLPVSKATGGVSFRGLT